MHMLLKGLGVAVIVTGSFAAPARAETNAPDYFIQSVFDVSTAEQLVAGCPTVSFHHEFAVTQSDLLFERLDADGLDRVTFYDNLVGVEDAVAELQTAFVATYDLATPTTAKVCAAAMAEIEAETILGGYLLGGVE